MNVRYNNIIIKIKEKYVQVYEYSYVSDMGICHMAVTAT